MSVSSSSASVVIVRDSVILLKIAWFGGSRFVIADRAVPMLDCGGKSAGCGVEPVKVLSSARTYCCPLPGLFILEYVSA